jgi:hypothetical protein
MQLSRRTLTRLLEVIDSINAAFEGVARRASEHARTNYIHGEATWKQWERILFEHEVPDFVLDHAGSQYQFDWDRMVRDLATGAFFYTQYGPIVQEAELPRDQYALFGNLLLGHLAAIVVKGEFGPTGPMPGGLKTDALIRSLEHDGYAVDTRKVLLVKAEGPVSHEEEESRLAELLGRSGLPNIATSKKHLKDAVDQYVDGTKDHSSLGESRTLLQSLLDDISTTIDKTGLTSNVKLPGGTANRLDYMEKIGLFSSDERAAFGAAWGFLSAGSHPGLPPREQARIGLVLSMEFCQMLLFKWQHWRQQKGL